MGSGIYLVSRNSTTLSILWWIVVSLVESTELQRSLSLWRWYLRRLVIPGFSKFELGRKSSDTLKLAVVVRGRMLNKNVLFNSRI
jgi:hypothetical protein